MNYGKQDPFNLVKEEEKKGAKLIESARKNSAEILFEGDREIKQLKKHIDKEIIEYSVAAEEESKEKYHKQIKKLDAGLKKELSDIDEKLENRSEAIVESLIKDYSK